MNTISNANTSPINSINPVENLQAENKPKVLINQHTESEVKIDAIKNDIAVDEAKKSTEKPPTEMTSNQLEMVAQQLQDFVGGMNKGLEFSVDKDSGRDVVKVIDKSSGDLIKQYPSEELLSVVSKLSDATGALINEKV